MDGVRQMRINSTMLAVAALLLGSACTNQTTKKAEMTNEANVQMSSIRWDEVVVPTQSARVSNGNLIFMR